MAAQSLAAGEARVRARVKVQGTVQGVGFRPFVYRLAEALGVGGFVRNDSNGVLLELEGPVPAVRDLLARLEREPPPLAVLDRLETSWLEPRGVEEFLILQSASDEAPNAPVTADAATCEDCLAELFDSSDRRYRYPFINCTNCGPRFTIVRGVPYDRPLTTMAAFQMCAECRREYEDPGDRRFHAQPNACPACGPQVTLRDAAASELATGEGALQQAAAALQRGAILALKGLGGYHLACLAADEPAASALRARKHREDKPFALMAPDLAAARALVELTALEEAIMRERERPIVIARRRAHAPVASAVAPRSRDLGVMLPYSPLHHLLLRDVAATLVMTSGNVSDEPIAYRDDDAFGRLAGIADLFLVHDRPIATRTDDSVVRATRRRTPPLLIRRSRGYAPSAIALPLPSGRQLLACGAELKNTFCVAKGTRAWVSHHIGEMHNYETLQSFSHGIEHFTRLFGVRPQVVAHDLHPEYLSTKYALDRDDLEPVAVQHHHAHLAACLAEHGERGPAIGAIYDGTGYGTDGSIWGGELLVGDLERFERAGHLLPVRLPGGERAVREPWRMACAWLLAAQDDPAAPPGPIAQAIAADSWRAVGELARRGVASPLTTSMGRLFDAVAALCGVRLAVTYEGQAAAELEALCDPSERGSYAMPLLLGNAEIILDPRPTVSEIARDIQRGAPTARIAARFHNAVATATASACIALAGRRDLGTVALGGGSFQNRVLLESVAAILHRAGLRVLVPERLPPNDGGISYGQAAVAAASLARAL
ncbi:MAG: carbamoyltransferase HypF [Solirubrobacterales bacterium]|nr:carbamoyltransferase HypF [Solirubrobacterales bacterium]